MQAAVPIAYLRQDQVEAWQREPSVPFADRKDSPVYMQVVIPNINHVPVPVYLLSSDTFSQYANSFRSA